MSQHHASRPEAGCRRAAPLRVALMLVWVLTIVAVSWFPATAAIHSRHATRGAMAVRAVHPSVASLQMGPNLKWVTAGMPDRPDIEPLDDADDKLPVPATPRTLAPALAPIQPRAPCTALPSHDGHCHGARSPPLS
jgi:hypothetical protein